MTELAAAILEMVRARKHVSFAELSRIEGFKGRQELLLDNPKGGAPLVLWSGLSPEAIEALAYLREARLIVPAPCPPLVYLIDGAMLTYPIAKSGRPTKKSRWLPTVFNPGRGSEAQEPAA